MIFTTILYNKDTRSACLLVFLNLHHFKRDSYIAMQMSGHILFHPVEGRRMVAVTHLADIARSQKTRTAFWDKSCFARAFFKVMRYERCAE